VFLGAISLAGVFGRLPPSLAAIEAAQSGFGIVNRYGLFAVMTLAFILLASSHAPAHLRAAVRHPMLIAVMLWSIVHLFANGDTRGTILFAAFLGWALVDLVSVVRRRAVATFEPRWRADLIAIVAGTLIALLVMTFHRVLFGPAVVPFSV